MSKTPHELRFDMIKYTADITGGINSKCFQDTLNNIQRYVDSGSFQEKPATNRVINFAHGATLKNTAPTFGNTHIFDYTLPRQCGATTSLMFNCQYFGSFIFLAIDNNAAEYAKKEYEAVCQWRGATDNEHFLSYRSASPLKGRSVDMIAFDNCGKLSINRENQEITVGGVRYEIPEYVKVVINVNTVESL